MPVRSLEPNANRRRLSDLLVTELASPALLPQGQYPEPDTPFQPCLALGRVRMPVLARLGPQPHYAALEVDASSPMGQR